MEGKQLIDEKSIGERELFDFSTFSEGIYIVRLKIGERYFSNKIVLTND